MPDFNFHEYPNNYTGSRMPTRRPIARPQSARMNSCRCNAAQHDTSLDGGYQVATMEDQHVRYHMSDMAMQSLRWQNEIKMIQAEALASKTDEREYYAELSKQNRQRQQHSERMWATLERQRSARSQSGASQQKSELIDERRDRLEQIRIRKAENRDKFLAAEQRRKGEQHAAEIAKEMQRTHYRMLQLKGDRQAWQEACQNREITNAEHLIRKKLREEATRFAGLSSDLQAVMHPKRERPRSAVICRPPKTGGIQVFSSDCPRKVASVYSDATDLGPRITVVDPRW